MFTMGLSDADAYRAVALNARYVPLVKWVVKATHLYTNRAFRRLKTIHKILMNFPFCFNTTNHLSQNCTIRPL